MEHVTTEGLPWQDASGPPVAHTCPGSFHLGPSQPRSFLTDRALSRPIVTGGRTASCTPGGTSIVGTPSARPARTGTTGAIRNVIQVACPHRPCATEAS